MNDDELRERARQLGVATFWFDIFGERHAVGVPTLQAVLGALGNAAERPKLPPLVTADVARPVFLPAAAAKYELVLEDGRRFEGTATEAPDGCTIPAILEAGYHSLVLGRTPCTLAVAPPSGCTLAELVPGGRAWGIAVQLYGLRRAGDAGIGDFAALADFARLAGGYGAQAVAISPVHAQFSADPDRFGPYAPSSRVALNVLHCAVDDGAEPGWAERAAALEASALVDWPEAASARLDRMRSIFAAARADGELMEDFHAFRQARGEALERHAQFEALHAYFYRQSAKFWDWRCWPSAFRDPARPQVAAFCRDYRRQVDFHAFLQFLADRGLQQAQAAARDAGMAIGLIADLAVGVDASGSQAWSQSSQILPLSIGAPPDLFQKAGQNWGLAALSPAGLRAGGFSAFLDMLRVSLAHAGGVRIDHAMGLRRLWVVPEGASAAEGTYLAYPEADLLRLLTLESFRQRAVVLAEDLGTVPDGFQDMLAARGIHGMRVLWFERDRQQAFVPPAQWTRLAAGMTSTHDLATVAGWWRGSDLAWRERLGTLGDGDRDERRTDRGRLWHAMTASGAAAGEMPAEDRGEDVAAAACVHVADGACALAILPIEDVLGLAEQPNLPNTTDEHPNWRRRLPADLPGEFAARRQVLQRIGRTRGGR